MKETPPNRRHDDGPKTDSPGIEARRIATAGAHVYSGPGLPGEFLVVWKIEDNYKTVVRDRGGAVLRITGGPTRDEAVRVAMNEPVREGITIGSAGGLRTDHTPESIVREPFHVRPLEARPGKHVTGERVSDEWHGMAVEAEKPPFSREGDLTAVLHSLQRAKGASMAIDSLDKALNGLPSDADSPSELTRDLATAEVLVRGMLLELNTTPHHPV